jgi:hypothetical protein
MEYSIVVETDFTLLCWSNGDYVELFLSPFMLLKGIQFSFYLFGFFVKSIEFFLEIIIDGD